MEITAEKLKELKNAITLPVAKKNNVRTTFNLSRQGHDAINEAAKAFGKTNAEMFDEMLGIYKLISESNIDLSSLSKDAKNKTRKTYVINKKTLSEITRISDKLKIPRDILIDNLAQTVKKIIELIASKKNEKYSNILKKIINPFWIEAKKIEKILIKELGDDDPVVNRFGLIIVIIMNLAGAIENYLNNGEPIDPEDLSQQ